MSDAAVLIGACGWQYPQWDTSYYPEGLPEEWRLAYYGNEYPVVLVPTAYWAQGVDVVDNWLQETDERPCFICEWTWDGESSRRGEWRAGIDALGERVKGILVTLQAMPDAAQLAEIRDLAERKAVCLDWPAAQGEQIRDVMVQIGLADKLSVCWHGDDEDESAAVLENGCLPLARVASEGQTPRSLRRLLETLLNKAGERQAVLLFDGDPPDLEIVDQAEVILNLL